MNLEESSRMYNLDKENIRLREQLQQERERAEQAEDRLGRLLDWITQGQMSGCNYTYEAMHQAVESAFMEAVRQQEERAERAERERDELAYELANKDATELSYLFQDKELHDMALSLASKLEEAKSRCIHLTNECAKLARRNADIEKEQDELREALKECMNHLTLPTEDPWMTEVDEVYQKARRILGQE